jgi:hypothetical protein
MELVKGGAHIKALDNDYKCLVDYNGKKVKFYFQHLDIHQMEEFVFLHKNFLLRFHDPGCFIVKPYFVWPTQ